MSIADSKTEALVVSEITDLAAEAQRVPVATGEVYLVRDGAGGLHTLDTDEYAPTPRRTAAARRVTDAESFVAYVNRHRLDGTEVYAHTSSSSVVAVIDSHEGNTGAPGWQKHTLTLALEHTKAWLAWTAHDLTAVGSKGWFDQLAFAEFIEDRALDVIEPDHARLIELATRFEATTKVEFGSAVRQDNGEVKFEYSETVGPKKGTKGDIDLPKELKLGLRPYIGGPIYYVTASLRYRIRQEGLVLGFALLRPESILEAAFADIVTEIRDGRTDTKDGTSTVIHTGVGDVPIFYGLPRS